MAEKRKIFIYFKLLFWLAGFIGAIFLIYSPIFLDISGKGSFMIGMFFSISSIASFLSQNIWGPLFDHFSSVKPFIFIGLISDILILSLIIYFPSPIAVIAGFSLIMLIGSAFMPAVQAASTFYHPDNKGKTLGQLFSYESIGWGCGSLAGMIVFSKLGIINLPVLFKIALFIAIILIFFALFIPPVKWERKIHRSFLRSMANQYFLMRSKRALRVFSILLLWICICNSIFFSYFGIYFKEIIGGNESLIGLIMLLATIFGAITFPIYGKIGDKKKSIFLLNFVFIAYITCFFSLIFIKSKLAVMLIYSAPFYPGLRIAGNLFISNHSNDHDRGTGLGLIESMHAIGMIIGPLLSGVILAKTGYKYLPVVATGFTFIYIPLYIILKNRGLNEKISHY